MYCVEVPSAAISDFFSVEQDGQWEVGYIFPATELFSFNDQLFNLTNRPINLTVVSLTERLGERGVLAGRLPLPLRGSPQSRGHPDRGQQ